MVSSEGLPSLHVLWGSTSQGDVCQCRSVTILRWYFFLFRLPRNQDRKHTIVPVQSRSNHLTSILDIAWKSKQQQRRNKSNHTPLGKDTRTTPLTENCERKRQHRSIASSQQAGQRHAVHVCGIRSWIA